MSDCSDYPTLSDAKGFKTNADTINEVVTSNDDRTSPSIDGSTKITLAGIERRADQQYAEVADKYAIRNVGAYNTNPTINEYFEFVDYNGSPYFAVSPPYTVDSTTYPDPSSDSNLRLGSATDLSLVTATGSTTPRQLNERFSDVVFVDDFGAVGDGVTDDTSAISAAIAHAISRRDVSEVYSTSPVVTGNKLYAVSDLELPSYASINLRLTNSGTSPCFFVNGRDVDLNKTTITPRFGFTGYAWEIDTSRASSASQFGRLKCETLTVDGQNAPDCKFGRVLFDNQSALSEASFWDCKFLSIGCAEGFTVTIESNPSFIQYWNANRIHITAINFEGNPFSIYLNNGTNLEASENDISMSLQPGNRTTDGCKIYGGIQASRNKFSGAIFDWGVFAPSGTYAIFDRGFSTTYSGISGAYISPGIQSNAMFNGTNGTHSRFSIVPSDADDRNVLGNQDNMLSFSDKKPNFSVSLSDPFDSGSESRLFSLDSYNVQSWTGLTPTDLRTITITHPRAQMRHITASFQLNAVPRYVKVEYLNASGVWNTVSETSSNYSVTAGYFAGVTTGQGVRADGVRFTFGDPVDIGVSTSGEPQQTTLIRVTNIFGASAEKSNPDSYQEVGSVTLTDNFVTMTNPSVPGNVTGRVQTKAIAIRDEAGTVIGHVPIFDIP